MDFTGQRKDLGQHSVSGLSEDKERAGADFEGKVIIGEMHEETWNPRGVCRLYSKSNRSESVLRILYISTHLRITAAEADNSRIFIHVK